MSSLCVKKWNILPPSEIKRSVNVKSLKANYRRHTGSSPSQAADASRDRMPETNGTRLDEAFPEEPSTRADGNHHTSILYK